MPNIWELKQVGKSENEELDWPLWVGEYRETKYRDHTLLTCGSIGRRQDLVTFYISTFTETLPYYQVTEKTTKFIFKMVSLSIYFSVKSPKVQIHLRLL